MYRVLGMYVLFYIFFDNWTTSLLEINHELIIKYDLSL